MPMTRDIEKARALVGDITAEDLRYVDYYVSDSLGIFIPSVGFCQYAIQLRHTHPSYSFVLFFSMEHSFVPVEIEVQAEHYLVTAMSPGIPHEEEQTEAFTRYVALMISRELYESLYVDYRADGPGVYEWDQFLVPHDIMFLLKKFMAEHENKMPGCHQNMEALAVLITHQVIRSILRANSPGDSAAGRFEIQRVIDYIHQNYGEKLSVAGLAGIVNMSESNFARTFRKETGLSPMEYRIRLRLDKAKKLLRAGNMKVTEVSLQCGFNSVSHFSTCFTKHLGMTPSGYQNAYSET